MSHAPSKNDDKVRQCGKGNSRIGLKILFEADLEGEEGEKLAGHCIGGRKDGK